MLVHMTCMVSDVTLRPLLVRKQSLGSGFAIASVAEADATGLNAECRSNAQMAASR